MKIRSVLLLLALSTSITSQTQAQTESCQCNSTTATATFIDDSICDFGGSYVAKHPDAGRYCYGTRNDQWFDLYLAKNEEGEIIDAPIFIWAHGNSGQADTQSARETIWEGTLKGNGIHFLSWESINSILLSNPEEVLETYLDLKRIVQLLGGGIPLDGAADSPMITSIETDKVFIGGASRGTLVSWFFTQIHGTDVRGIYNVQAFPNGIWYITDPRDWLNRDSPPMILNYNQDYYSNNYHDAINGKLVFDAYEELGLNCRIRRNLANSSASLYDELVGFINNESSVIFEEVDPVNDEDIVPTDGKDARCNEELYADFIANNPGVNFPVNCFELIRGSNFQRPKALVPTTPTPQTVTFQWEERVAQNGNRAWDNVFGTFDPSTDIHDRCLFRVYETDDNDVNNGVPITGLLTIPKPFVMDPDRLGVTDWPLPSNYLTPNMTVYLAFQAKCTIDGFETKWSNYRILTLNNPPAPGIAETALAQKSAEQNYLNLTYDQVNLVINTSLEGKHGLSIFNILGQELHAENVVLQEGPNLHNFKGDLSSGVYIVVLTGKGQAVSEKILVR